MNLNRGGGVRKENKGKNERGKADPRIQGAW